MRVNDGAPLVGINQDPINVTFAVPEQNLLDIKRHRQAARLMWMPDSHSDRGPTRTGRISLYR